MQIDNYSTDVFVIVPARDGKNVPAKIKELKSIGVSFKIICGEHFDHPNVVYRENNGKWDALNFGASFVPKETRVVALNDVNTQICNFEDAITHLNEEVGLVYCKVNVAEGPQVKFYRIMDQLRQRFHIAASGELMLIDRRLFDRLIPVPPCIAEDSYILFKALKPAQKLTFPQQPTSRHSEHPTASKKPNTRTEPPWASTKPWTSRNPRQK